MDVTSVAVATADHLFPDLALGDRRRDRRFGTVVRAVAQRPGASLPQLFPDPTQYHAVLNLFHGPGLTHEAVLTAHAAAVLDDLEARTEPVLFLHDATPLDFSGHTTLADDLGPIGNGGGRGWVAHQTLAVDPTTRVVYGLVSQILHVRAEAVAGERVGERRRRASRESRLWERGVDAVGPAPAGCHWVHVADRGADGFEFLQALTDRRQRFVIRSAYNRALGAGPSDAKAAELLHDRLTGRPPQARWPLALPARPGVRARTAHLAGVAEPVRLRPPTVHKGQYRPEPIAVWAIRAWEPDPPPGAEPVEWFLLTSEPADTPADIERLVGWYACRWLIEEFHKVQKSGLAVERYQLQAAGAMAALVAVLSVIAVPVLNLRRAARDPASRALPAEAVVPAAWVVALRRLQAGPARPWTVADFVVALARRGGYLTNPARHPPGWITLWRGWIDLHVALQLLTSSPEIT